MLTRKDDKFKILSHYATENKNHADGMILPPKSPH